MFNKLTDYQIAESFGPTLSLIYKNKMAELNEDLQEIYNHLDKLDIPRYTDFDRWFARETLPHWAIEKFKAIDHINKIRNLYRKIKNMPESEKLDIEKAKAVPILDIIGGAMKRGNMTHCPFHTDSHPSAKINKNNTLKCFSCGFYGDSVAVWMKINNVNFKDAVNQLNKI